MHKSDEGPVIWRKSKCMGCRFCMISCPFDVPRFEYDSAAPKIQKCIMCYQRLERGEQPACVQACPVDALQFGTRRQLIDLAQSRIYRHPWLYQHHIYGEHEVGGTGWLYLSQVPYDQIGFRTDLGNETVPSLSREFLYSVPVVFLVWPVFLSAIHRSRSGENEEHSGNQLIDSGDSA
jgi:ferredoxin